LLLAAGGTEYLQVVNMISIQQNIKHIKSLCFNLIFDFIPKLCLPLFQILNHQIAFLGLGVSRCRTPTPTLVITLNYVIFSNY